nr:MAG TPA: hypothetical protein [Caudoviricetes sp.]
MLMTASVRGGVTMISQFIGRERRIYESFSDFR